MIVRKWWSVALPATLAFTATARAETPEGKAARLSAQAVEQEAKAEAELPPPELTLDVWRIPVTRPYDVPGADMIRLGVEQELVSPAEREARRGAAQLRGDALRAEGETRSRELFLRLAHARVEQARAEAAHAVHQRHLSLAQRALELSRARHAAGGVLADVTLAEIEVAEADAAVSGDAARAESAESVVAALRAGGAEPAAPSNGERPELRALRLSREAELRTARAEQARSNWPDFRVGASYFAPTRERDAHAFGITLGMKLPWAWGARAELSRAALGRAEALQAERAAKQRDLALNAELARGELRAVRSRLRVTRERTLQLAERGRALADASYETEKGRLDDLLRAEAKRLEVEMEIVELEARIAHLEVDRAYWEAGSRAGDLSTQERAHAR